MQIRNSVKALVLGAALLTTGTFAAAQHHDDDHGRPGNQGRQDFHFGNDDRNAFRGHYANDINRWRGNRNRPSFRAGDHLPPNYRVQAVPSSYYRGRPAPPPGYRYGYYDGYVVAYNPTTRIIADVLDLVTGN